MCIPLIVKKRLSKCDNFLTPMGDGIFGMKPYGYHKNSPDPYENIKTQDLKSKNFLDIAKKRNRVIKRLDNIQYTYIEGYTNAVKRKSYIKHWI